jgi:hypothetical protein
VYTSKPRGVSGLVVRELDRLDARFVAGSEDGLDPFLSPDGTQIGFTTYTDLKRVPVAGGPAETICPVETYFSGATWGPGDAIVFTQGVHGLFRVAATGGKPERLAFPDIEKDERGFLRPVLLPDGQTVLYTLIFTDGATRIVARRGGGDPYDRQAVRPGVSSSGHRSRPGTAMVDSTPPRRTVGQQCRSWASPTTRGWPERRGVATADVCVPATSVGASCGSTAVQARCPVFGRRGREPASPPTAEVRP